MRCSDKHNCSLSFIALTVACSTKWHMHSAATTIELIIVLQDRSKRRKNSNIRRERKEGKEVTILLIYRTCFICQMLQMLYYSSYLLHVFFFYFTWQLFQQRVIIIKNVFCTVDRVIKSLSRKDPAIKCNVSVFPQN